MDIKKLATNKGVIAAFIAFIIAIAAAYNIDLSALTGTTSAPAETEIHVPAE